MSLGSYTCIVFDETELSGIEEVRKEIMTFQQAVHDLGENKIQVFIVLRISKPTSSCPTMP